MKILETINELLDNAYEREDSNSYNKILEVKNKLTPKFEIGDIV